MVVKLALGQWQHNTKDREEHNYLPSDSFAVSTVKLDRHPGWDQHSWGYHGDSGNSFDCSVEAPYGPTFSSSFRVLFWVSCFAYASLALAGDVIGCGVDFSSNEAFFTKNGDLIGISNVLYSLCYDLTQKSFSVGRVFRNVGKDCQIHAFIGLRHGGQVVRANFGRDPFRYNIAGLNKVIFTFPLSEPLSAIQKATETSDLNETDIDILAFIPPVRLVYWTSVNLTSILS